MREFPEWVREVLFWCIKGKIEVLGRSSVRALRPSVKGILNIRPLDTLHKQRLLCRKALIDQVLFLFCGQHQNSVVFLFYNNGMIEPLQKFVVHDCGRILTDISKVTIPFYEVVHVDGYGVKKKKYYLMDYVGCLKCGEPCKKKHRVFCSPECMYAYRNR